MIPHYPGKVNAARSFSLLHSERCELLLVVKEPNSLYHIRKSTPAALLHLSKQPLLRHRTKRKKKRQVK